MFALSVREGAGQLRSFPPNRSPPYTKSLRFAQALAFVTCVVIECATKTEQYCYGQGNCDCPPNQDQDVFSCLHADNASTNAQVKVRRYDVRYRLQYTEKPGFPDKLSPTAVLRHRTSVSLHLRGVVNDLRGGQRSLGTPSARCRTVIVPETPFIRAFGPGHGSAFGGSPSPPRSPVISSCAVIIRRPAPSACSCYVAKLLRRVASLRIHSMMTANRRREIATFAIWKRGAGATADNRCNGV